MTKNPLLCLAFISTALATPTLSHASVNATGEFTASKSCQAYQSIRKKTNPGDIQLQIGQAYAIQQLNVPTEATWLRIQIEGAEPTERWVYFECGQISNLNTQSSGHHTSSQGSSHDNNCQTPDQADSYVFAVSWQAAFCEQHSSKPECKVADPSSYQANNFTLHGLWPNKQSCGTHYGFCDKSIQQQRNFCDYPKVPMNSTTLQQLGTVMPSAEYGSCLQRHEWYKHGTCQPRDADQYFDTAIKLLAEFNGKGNNSLAQFMQDNIGKTVKIDALNQKIDQIFGANAHQRMRYSCTSDNKLVDIYMNLPLDLDQPLTTLLPQGKAGYHNGCGNSFVVDPIN